jgi:WD40 repeat protein
MWTISRAMLAPALLGLVTCLSWTTMAGQDVAETVDSGPEPAGRASPTATDGKVLVPTGEKIDDIATIIEGLDRRSPVNAVAFSPDGSLFVTGAEDHVVRVWQRDTGRLVRRLDGHRSTVTAVGFSPDGTIIASASNDRTARLWDARSGQLLRTLQGHVYHVYALAFDPRGRWLATASWDQTIQLWDLKSGEMVKKLRGHSAPVRAIDFSPDGQWLASGADDQTVRLWDTSTGRERRGLGGHTGPVAAVRFGPDGQWLFSGSADHTVRMWRLPDGGHERRLADCGAPVLSLSVAANGQILGGACGAGGSVLWDVGTGSELRRGRGHTGDTRAIAISSDGRLVATAAEDATVIVDDVASGRTVVSLGADLAPLVAVALAPDGQATAGVSRDGRILLWENRGAHPRPRRLVQAEQGPVRTVALSSDGKLLATGEGSRVALWDLASEGEARKLKGHEGTVTALAFLPGSSTLASGAEDATLRLWDLRKAGAVKVLKGHRAPVQALAATADGSVLASASDDESVRLWDTTTGQNLAVLASRHGAATAVAFSSDGKFVVTGSREGVIDVWLSAKGKLLKALRKELPAAVVALALRGQQIVAASADGVLSIFELGGTRPVKQSDGVAGTPAAWAIAGGAIASGTRDGVLRMWDEQTLAQRWWLGGSSTERWFSCNDTHTCWRNENGTLLGRASPQGQWRPVPPSDAAHRTSLKAYVDPSTVPGAFALREGRTLSIPIRIENRGPHPAYWVSVAESDGSARAGGGALLLIPPSALTKLGPGEHAVVTCEVSALAAYQNPEPRTETLRLAITSASSDGARVDVPIWVDAPHLQLRHLAMLRGPSEAVVASMTEVSMTELDPVLLQGSLVLDGQGQARIAPVSIEQPFIGQDLALAFPLPEGVKLDRTSRVTFTLRKSTHPAHLWTFAHAPVRIPLPVWLWGLGAGGLLALGFVGWRARLYVRARPVGRAGKRLYRTVLLVLLGIGKVLVALVCIRSTVRLVVERMRRRGVAATFFRLQPETQCSHLARQLGASWEPVLGWDKPVFDLRLGRELPLNIERCLLALPTAEGIASLLAELDAVEEDPAGITVVLAELPRAEVAAQLLRPRRLVVLNKATMYRVLHAPRPALVFAQVASEQVDRRELSLYRSAVSSGPRQPFYGRKAELRKITSDPSRNYLLVGPHGIGKTSLLDEVHRRYAEHPSVECLYLSLADGDLTTALADALGMPGERLLDVLLERLADGPKGKHVVVLCDDADAWATLDASHGGAQLQTLALLSQQHPCSFVLAGFLGLLYAARPVRGRKRFGELVRLEELDAEACAELATVPMAALNVGYTKSDLVEQLIQQSAGMPGLISVVCDQMLGTLDPQRRILERGDLDDAYKSEAVARTITAWRPRFGLQEPRYATLDQTVMLSAVFKPRFSLEELQSTLVGLGVEAEATEIRHSAGRLVAACVFEQWLGQFQFRVPLFQTVMQEATLARMIARLTPDESAPA